MIETVCEERVAHCVHNYSTKNPPSSLREGTHSPYTPYSKLSHLAFKIQDFPAATIQRMLFASASADEHSKSTLGKKISLI
jgi:hypothetical protein